jgi:signal transduction histidine kinase
VIDLKTISATHFPWALEHNLRRLADRRKVLESFLEAVRIRLDADCSWLWGAGASGLLGFERRLDGEPSLCDWELSENFAAEQRRAALPHKLLLARIEAHGRLVGVAGAGRRAGRSFEMGHGRVLSRLSSVLGSDLERREEIRIDAVLDRIREKVVAELRPRDLSYQILDGLYQLVHYDHSAALLMHDREGRAFRVEAEKVVWAKSKSAFIGHEIPSTPELLAAFSLPAGPRVLVIEPGGARGEAVRLGEIIDRELRYHRGHGIPGFTSLLVAPLFYDNELLGLLKIAALRRPPFDAHDVAVVESFLPVATVSLRNAQMRVSLESQAMNAEVRAGLVTLARAVAHDVNNAIGSILPVVEQLREEIGLGILDPASLSRDLEVIGEKAALCRRIFSNMLTLASERSRGGPVDIHQLIRHVLPLLEAQAAPRQVKLELDFEEPLPPVRCSKDHIERILWNLVNNSIEALSGRSGTITIATRSGGLRSGGAWSSEVQAAGSARKGEEMVSITVTDDGPGIPEQILSKVEEPFFSTKPGNTGLGLSLCRSLIWQNGGRVRLLSEVGKGTVVEVELPVALELAPLAGQT